MWLLQTWQNSDYSYSGNDWKRSALGFKNSSEADHRTETGRMMAMEITNNVEAELKAEGRRATNTGKIWIGGKFLSTTAIKVLGLVNRELGQKNLQKLPNTL